MSRVGKQPVKLLENVKANIANGVVAIEGPKGKLEHQVSPIISVKQENEELVVELVDSQVTPSQRALYGTTRALLNNMVLGVSQGWKKSLVLNGVGFTATLSGDQLKLVVGYSHDVFITIPKEVNCAVTKTTIDLDSADKQLVGNLAASIRKVCPPEPYLGKGIKYSDEVVRRKAGKTAK